MDAQDLDQVTEIVTMTDAAQDAVDELNRLFAILKTMQVSEFCTFDISIVRGLAYYTGVVFEIYDRNCQLRALGGGGRYDNLLKQFGGPQVTGTGMGMGDCVLGILLEEKGLLQKNLPKREIDYFIACADRDRFDDVIRIAAILRGKGFSASFSYKSSGLGKQLKQAADQGACKCVIVGQEMAQSQVQVKDMASSQQSLVDLQELLDSD
jgi:histidyl-tRNA synthetase